MTGNNYARITEYRQADFNRRLHMYLQYPRLRAEFILIDQAELNTAASSKARKLSPAIKVNEILGSVAASVKRIFGIASA